jgi:hypothetical protein
MKYIMPNSEGEIEKLMINVFDVIIYAVLSCATQDGNVDTLKLNKMLDILKYNLCSRNTHNLAVQNTNHILGMTLLPMASAVV